MRLWFVYIRQTAESLDNAIPLEIGYMNVIPKCLDTTGKYPVYENLPETYAAINEYLADSPLEDCMRFIDEVLMANQLTAEARFI
ncbi:hypothetical protein LSH36_854g00066 [Paralvinella palmiformis]|uniref:Uncharacterized protein n=1 Tax=Paralvinella palmiformis TaxID=53620 RepID=A0AAD9MS19_9ANNE|nr:hypothetical protein LSH36_854g00066 [Paralvinella palmiformis]